jgi:NAD(P)-dependent dehydrogenase (short-subunit alcohol dehydrogenase family)
MKRILVTGANSGIGLALTKQLVKDHGVFVYLGSRDVVRGQNAVDEVKKTAGENVELLNIDVSNEDSVRSAAEVLGSKLGSEKLYGLVNNAGTGIMHNTKAAEILDTNTRGPRRVINHFLPLIDEKCGRIVNVGSGGGPSFVSNIRNKKDKQRYLEPMSESQIEDEISKILSTNDDYAAYSGSKALLACYTMELANNHPNLMISIITPGYIKTAMTKGAGATKEPHEGTLCLKKVLFEDLPSSGWFWGSDGLRSPLHWMRNPGEPEFDGVVDL